MSAPHPAADARGPLTPRQQEILRRYEAGHSATRIGKDLGISSQAVQGHFQRIRSKGHAVAYRLPRPSAPNAAPISPAGIADSALAIVHASITEQECRLAERLHEIPEEIAELERERSRLQEGIAALRRMQADA